MSVTNPNWNDLTEKQRGHIRKAAETYTLPGGAGPEEIASEMFYAVGEAIQAHPVECYWNGDDRELGHADPGEILDYIGPGSVVEIEHVAVVKVTYEARLPPAADSEHDDDFEVCEGSSEAANAAISAELSRRATLTAPEIKTSN